MRFVKIGALVCALVLLAGGGARAQGDDAGKLAQIAKIPPAERAKVQTLVMKEKLALTPDEVPKVAEINAQTATQIQPVLTAADGPLVRMHKIKAIEAQRDESLQKVLQPQQYQQWLAEKDAMRQKIEAKLLEKVQGGAH